MTLATGTTHTHAGPLEDAAPAGKNPVAHPSTAATIEARARDWRNGPTVYQVIVDRFAQPANLDAKRDLYPAPKRLRAWDEQPRRGTYVPEANVWSHEIDFWGGDLESVLSKIDYITSDLAVDVLYLNPIHDAFTNHKYDARDYFRVSPEYGTREDVGRLADALHARQRHLVLDGVFNHMGRQSTWFQRGQTTGTAEHGYFFLGSQYQHGYRAWYNVANLPELKLENAKLRQRLWGARDSVIQGYLRNEKVDGWRLDVAFDIGPRYLDELTRAAHSARPGSVVIGEIWNYPASWFPAIDGIMNMTAREIIIKTVQGHISGPRTARLLETMVADCGIEPLLKSWIILDNHDTPRLRHSLKEVWQQRMAQVLQTTMPGSPCIYYGVEVGMQGGDDPEMRGPMPWAEATPKNETFAWTQRLLRIRHESPALRYGDFLRLDSDRLLAYKRTTHRVADTRIILVNPTDTKVTETLMLRDGRIMSSETLEDMLDDGQTKFRTFSGTVTVELAPHSTHILRPVIGEGPNYTPYKRTP